MSITSAEDRTSPVNPYETPTSSPSLFQKRYLTLAICGGLLVIAVLTAVVLFATMPIRRGRPYQVHEQVETVRP